MSEPINSWDQTEALVQSRFMKAVRREPVDCTPVWIMRQAGRYMPEYMAVRNKVTFLELCHTPELAAQVTLEAREILGVDAAILFADLLPILQPMGFDLTYEKGEGPVIHNPINEASDVDRVHEVEDLDRLGYVYDAITLIRNQLPANIPLLGFAGAPFTLASYAIEGGGSSNYVKTKRFMYAHPEAWKNLLSRLAVSVGKYLTRQLQQGCQAVQIFDSWAGCLSPYDYQNYVLPYTKMVFDQLPENAYAINFLTGNPALLPMQRQAGGNVMGIDWRVDLDKAWEIVGHDVAVQGNMEPMVLFSDIPQIKQRAHDVLNKAGKRPGHIFNLGHGVHPEMNPEHVKALVNIVHDYPLH